MSQPLREPVPLDGDHDTNSFRCGNPALDEFLRRHALQGQHSGSSRTFVACRGSMVVGYYSLAAGSVRLEDVPPRVARGVPRHPVPVLLLARLAVDQSERGRGLGAALLKNACQRSLQASAVIGGRALLTHAKDESARSFYLRFGFEPSPTDPLHVLLLTKDLRRTLG